MKNKKFNIENTVTNPAEVFDDVVVHFPYRAYVYYWYHHMMPTEEREKITQTIKNKDYFAFVELYKKYSIQAIENGKYYEEIKAWLPMVFLPSTISVYDDKAENIEHISVLDQENFDKIAEIECECG